MPINPIDGVWAESGTREPTLSAAKKDAGFVGGDKVLIERLNELHGRSDDAVNQVIQERVNSSYDGSADAALALTTGIWPDAWAMTGESANVISGGAAKSYFDMCAFYTSTGAPRLLIMDMTARKFEVWNPRTLALVDTSDVFTDDLPAVGGEVYELVSMCTDGTNVYATIKDTNAAPDEHYLQAWEIATWDVVTGWPTTGTALTGTGNGPLATYKDSKVIIADDDNLAVSCGWTLVTGSGDPAIQLFARHAYGAFNAGDAVRDGAGDCQAGVGMYPCEGICSDGTNIFFAANDGANATQICSASIADLTTDSGGANYPRGFACDGARLCMVGSGTYISVIPIAGAAAPIIHNHDAADATYDAINRGVDDAALSGNSIVMDDNCYAIIFDGINAWLLTDIDNNAGDNQMAFVKFDVATMSNLATNTTRQLTDIASTYIVEPSVASDYVTGLNLQIAFDGRDVWAVIDPHGTNPNSGKIFRLPLALLRS